MLGASKLYLAFEVASSSGIAEKHSLWLQLCVVVTYALMS